MRDELRRRECSGAEQSQGMASENAEAEEVTAPGPRSSFRYGQIPRSIATFPTRRIAST